MRAEILHAEAGAIDADVAQRLRQIPRQIAWIQLDRMFADRRQVKMASELIGDELELAGVEDRRRSTAPMDMRDSTLAGVAGDERDLVSQALRVSDDRLVPQRRLGVTAAVVAKLPAERYVQVQ